MPRRKAASAADEVTSEKQARREENATVADRARQMAERIRRLPDDLVTSFALANPIERVGKLKHIALEISVDMLPVISWLERNRPAANAELVKRRMHYALQEIVQCAELEIPEYSGGIIHRQSGEKPSSEGASRTAEIVVFVMVFSATLHEWAEDIEAEETSRTPRTEIRESQALARHSSDFRSVHWYGTDYTFTKEQARVVEQLWQEWEMARQR